jgi:hypothetical protein
MLKKSASVVLTSLRGSPYGGEYASPLYSPAYLLQEPVITNEATEDLEACSY